MVWHHRVNEQVSYRYELVKLTDKKRRARTCDHLVSATVTSEYAFVLDHVRESHHQQSLSVYAISQVHINSQCWYDSHYDCLKLS